jgi:hypothetical protein
VGITLIEDNIAQGDITLRITGGLVIPDIDAIIREVPGDRP